MNVVQAQVRKHRTFVSFHHADERYKNQFADMMEGNIVDESVGDGDIDSRIKTETIRQKIRDEFIRDATVTVVLIGPRTWQRKYVDWEIGSSLRDTRLNARCGLLGILLPNHPDYGKRSYNHRLIPPRLADNCQGDDPFAHIYDWTNHASDIRRWVHRAFQRRQGTPPNNGRTQFRNNRSGDYRRGWQN